MEPKQSILTRTWVVAALACVCCILWGSAIPTIKTGYRLLQVDSADTASQIVFAGVRFTLAGLLVLLFTSLKEKKAMLPGPADSDLCSSGLPGSDICPVFLLLYRCGTYIRSQRRHYHRSWKFYSNLIFLPAFPERKNDRP